MPSFVRAVSIILLLGAMVWLFAPTGSLRQAGYSVGYYWDAMVDRVRTYGR